MPQNPNILQALQGLESYFPNNPSGQLFNLQQQRRDELTRRLGSQLRGGSLPNELAGTAQNLSTLDRDIAESPITQQGQEVDAINQANQAAVLRGFLGGGTQSPAQQAGQAQMAMEREKVNVPVRAAEIEAAGAFGRQQEASKGALAVEQERTNAIKNNPFLQMLQGGATPEQLRGISVNRTGGSMTFQTPQKPTDPTALLRDVNVARMRAEESHKGQLWSSETPADRALKTVMSTAVLRYPTDDIVKDWVIGIINDPIAMKKGLDAILQERGEDPTPEQYQAMKILLGAFQGSN